MPLSEEEQRVLDEIERQLYETDPQLAHQVRTRSAPASAARRVRWGALGTVVGLSILVAGFRTSVIFGLAGFLLMVVSLVVLEQAVRSATAGTSSAWAQKVRQRASERSPQRRRPPGI